LRKKSHISLACYLVHQTPSNELQKHKKAFYLGSILPDCKPSFLTTKHEFDGTFDMIKHKICTLSENTDKMKTNSRSYIRELGEVIHYIADYFTFPHNHTYDGNLKDHCFYEKDLKFALRHYLKSGQAVSDMTFMRRFDTPSALLGFIKRAHNEYLDRKRSVKDDCEYIVRICHNVVHAILNMLSIKMDAILNFG